MTKPQNSSEQLRLRLLVEVRGQTSDLTDLAKEKQSAETSSKMTMALPASENDMSVYRQISGNYFRSLQKA